MSFSSERINQLETKYGGTFREVFGNGFPDGENYGAMAMDYVEWSHLEGVVAKENLTKRKGKGVDKS